MPSRRRPDPIDVLVGSNIRIHRLKSGLTQIQLAKRLGISFQQVQKYEDGLQRVRIAKELRVPISAFFQHAKGPRNKIDKPLAALISQPAGIATPKSILPNWGPTKATIGDQFAGRTRLN